MLDNFLNLRIGSTFLSKKLRLDFFQLFSFSLLIFLLVACGNPKAQVIARKKKSGKSADQAALFFTEYKKLIHPFVVQKCGSCHSTTSPVFASQDAILSAQAVLQSKKIDFEQPENSRLVQRLLKDNHNCGTKDLCDATGLEMKQKILQLVKLVGSSKSTLPNLTGELTLQDARFVHRVNSTQGDLFIEAKDMGLPALSEGDLTFVRPTSAASNVTTEIKRPGSYYIWAYARIGDASSLRTTGSYKEYSEEQNANPAPKQLPANFSNLTNTKGKFEWVLLNRVNAQSGAVDSFRMNSQNISLSVSGSNIDLAYLLITDIDYKKSSEGHPSAGENVLEFDLSGLSISGKLQIGARIYDPQGSKSYLFTAPRFLGSRSVKFKGLKLTVNGKWNPVHSLFNKIDVTVSNGQYLTSGAMVVDAVSENDRFAISFDSIDAP